MMVLTLGLGQNCQPHVKMPKQMPTLSQNVQQYSHPRLKFSRIF
jgi:hypothetical protein